MQFDNGLPIYLQIVKEMTLRALSGAIKPGEKIPPVRELAAEFGVNPNTMQRAMAELERDGLVYSQRTSGRFVTEDETMIQQAKRGLAERHIKTFVAAMVRLGFRREEMIALLRQETGEENDHGSFDL